MHSLEICAMLTDRLVSATYNAFVRSFMISQRKVLVIMFKLSTMIRGKITKDTVAVNGAIGTAGGLVDSLQDY